MGSPLVCMRTNSSNLSKITGCVSIMDFLPPPGFLHLPLGKASVFGDESSCMPTVIVERDTPEMRLIRLIPPQPNAFASADKYTRR